MKCIPIQFDTYLLHSYVTCMMLLIVNSCGRFKRIDYAQMSFKRADFIIGLSLIISSQASLYSLKKIKLKIIKIKIKAKKIQTK